MESRKVVTRRFSDLEVARILTRTAELQSANASESEPAHGLTQEELEQIAREAGLDPGHVQVAIAELDAGQPAQRSRWLGGPSTLYLERSLSGEVPQSEYEALVEIIQRTLNEVGQPSLLGRTLRWHAVAAASGRRGHGREIEVVIATRSGQTTVRIQEKLRALATNLFAGIMAGGGSSAGMMAGAFTAAALGPLGAVAVGAAAVGGSYGLARILFRARSRVRAEQLSRLMDRLAEHVVATAAHAPVLGAGGDPGRLGSGEGR
jgi:hypothetical protein